MGRGIVGTVKTERVRGVEGEVGMAEGCAQRREHTLYA